MSTQYILTSKTSTTTSTVTLTAGDDVVEVAGVYLADEASSGSTAAIFDASYGVAQIYGDVFGNNGLFFGGASGQTTILQIGAAGVVSTSGSASAALTVGTGYYQVSNLGEIDSVYSAVDLDNNNVAGSNGSGGGTLTNKGTIDSTNGDAIHNEDTSTNVDQLNNYGVISGEGDTILDEGGHSTIINNYGSIINTINNAAPPPRSHAINTSGAGTETVNNAGQISGNIGFAAAASLTDSGTIDGSVLFNGRAAAGDIDVDVTSTGIIAGTPGTNTLSMEQGGYQIVNNGEITASADNAGDAPVAVVFYAGGTLTNYGVIGSSAGDDILSEASSGHTFIYNYGSLYASNGGSVNDYAAIANNAGTTVSILNYGSIQGGSGSAGNEAITSGATSDDYLVNSGKITGDVSLGDGSALTDSGVINGAVTLAGANSGKTDVVVLAGGVLAGSPGDDALTIGQGAYGDGAYDIVNDGEIVATQNASNSTFAAGVSVQGAGKIVNKGTIAASSGNAILDNAGGGIDDYIGNYGLISSSDSYSGETNAAIFDTGGHADTIFNAGEIDGGSAQSVVNAASVRASVTPDVSGLSTNFAIYSTGADTLDNVGTIAGEISLGFGSSLVDSGKIAGEVSLAGSFGATTNVSVSHGGVIAGSPGDDALEIAAGAYDIVNNGEILASQNPSGSGYPAAVDVNGAGKILNSGTISSGGYDAVLDGAGSGDEDIVNNSGTIDSIYDFNGHTDTIFNTGAIDVGAGLAANSAIYADSTSVDLIDNLGQINGAVTLGAAGSHIVNHGLIDGAIDFAAGSALFMNRGAIDGNVTFSGTANYYSSVGGTVNGTIFGAGNTSTYVSGADNETFNFTASGAGAVYGGAGSDTFIFTTSGLTAATYVHGAAGASDDVLQFSNAGTIAQADFTHVSGIEAIELFNGTNSLSVTNAMLASATGNAMTILGGTGADTINAGGVTAASDKLTIDGGGGADVITAGGGTDTFLYKTVADSYGPYYDTIFGANFALDTFDIPGGIGSILAINPTVTTGSLSTSTFNSDLTTDLPAAKLGVHDAVLFTANAGTLSGDTFLVVGLNNTAGYTSNADLVVRLSGATGTLTTGNFV